MKNKFNFILLIISSILSVKAQNYYMITFDGTGLYENAPGHWLVNPSSPTNVWEIGIPGKAIFNNTICPTKAIVTKSLTTYPTNNTSSFTIKHLANFGFTFPASVILSGQYFVNSDSLTDYGKIEFSPNNGATWIDLVTNTTYSSSILWNNPFVKPTLTGNSFGWKKFRVNLQGLGPAFGIALGDTVLWRFSFTSDAIQTNKDGLMYDSIWIADTPPLGIKDYASSDLKIFPLPFHDKLTIQRNNSHNNKVIIQTITGELILQTELKEENTEIDLSHLSDGLYFIKIDGLTYKVIKD